MGLQRKFWLFSVAWIIAIPVVLFFLAFFFYRSLPAEAQAAFKSSLLENLPLFLFACLLSIMGLLIWMNEVFQYFILPFEKLRDELRLITVVKPSHRIELRGSKDLQELADAVNQAAELIHLLQQNDSRPGHRGKEKRLKEDRDFMGAVLSDIPGGLVAANAAGRIFLYTKAAADLVDTMQDSGRRPPTAPPVGLDRSIFAVFAEPLGLPEQGWAEKGVTGCGSPNLFTEIRNRFTCHGILGRLFKIRSDKSGLSYYLVFLYPAEQNPREQAISMETGELTPKNAARDGRAAIEKRSSGLPHCDLALLRKKQGAAADIRDRNLAGLTYTVFDLETTGLNPKGGDEIISIGAVRIVNGRILFDETFYQMVSPAITIPRASTKIHGIDDNMLTGQPGIETVMPDFCRYFEDSILVCHCADLDCRFLSAHAQKAGIRIENPILDTFYLSRLVQPSEADHTLESIARRLGTRIYDRHIAYGDAWTTAEILLKLISLLGARDITTLRQIQEGGIYYLSS